MHYIASYVPLIREAEVISLKEITDSPKTKTIKISNAFDLKALLKPSDKLWLMMGSTNAAVALGAFRKDVEVHQLSMLRLMSLIGTDNASREDSGEEQNGRKFKVKTEHVLQAVLKRPDLFYATGAKQADALEISAAWQAVEDAMEQRKAAANFRRARTYQSAIAYHKILNQHLPEDPEEAMDILEETLSDLLDTKDTQGKKRIPGDQHIAFLVEEEDKERKQLDNVCRKNGLYQHVFGDVEGVGPALGARFIKAIERIERFNRPEDLSNYAGMLPRGKDGHMPSRFKSKGKTLSRSPKLNTACFLLQDYMFQWGRNTELGQLIQNQIQRECPCTQEQRNADKELRRCFSGTVKQARIAMSRHFLEKILYPKWKEYMGSAS